MSWPPRERAPAALLACLGLVISAYLTIAHFSQGQVSLACPIGGTVNCERVTTSAGSMVGPIPIAAIGVVWFAVALLLGLAPDRPDSTWSLRAVLVWSALGLVVVFYLIYVELFVVGAICLWCTAVHLLIIGLFLLAVRRAEVLAANRF